jgi:radical SAM superfamily enzyme YgiQ (UPF0313 family)
MQNNEELKVVICSLNSKYIHSSLAPWCLLAGIKKYCKSNISPFVVEGTINEDINNVANRILFSNPNVVGLSCYIWNINIVKQLIDIIKSALPGCIIVLGGPEVSYNCHEVLDENPLVDFIISGEGELPFAQLLDAIAQKERIDKISGLAFRNEKNVIFDKPNISSEDPSSPYTQEYFDSLNGRIAYLETSRGCPYSCAFCLSGRCGSVRFFDLERAKNEILMLANSGTQTIKFVDRTFNANKKRAIDIFEFIIDNYGKKIPNNICFHFEIAGDILNYEMIELLKTSPVGAIQLEIGIQSFNKKTLEYINRKTNISLLIDNIKKIIEKSNIHTHIDLIAGLPLEDFESFKKSFNVAFSLNSHMLQLGFLKLLHGSNMREQRDKFPCKYSKSPPYEVIETPWLSAQQLEDLHSTEEVLDRLYNSGRFRRTIDYVLKKSNLTPFDLFYEFGLFTKEMITAKLSLDDFTSIVFNFFCNKEYVNKLELRDEMVCDRLSTNPSGLIPKSLQVFNPLIKKAKYALENNPTTKRPYGIKRGFCLLEANPLAVYVDYQDKDPLNGDYKLKYFSYKDFM